MHRLLLALLLFLFAQRSVAQSNPREMDSVCTLVKEYFNKKDAGALYQLTGDAFKKALSAQRFQEIANNNLFPLGEMLQAVYEKENDGLSKYKAVFNSVTLAMYLGFDDHHKLQTFLFNEYVDERVRKTSTVASTNKLATALDRKVDSVAQPYITLEATAGLSIGILKNGRSYFYGYGETAKGNKQIPNENTIFEIGSISKTFTAILLADAVDKGLINLNDPVSNYLPSSIPLLQFEGVPVTMKMLSNHSSALPRMPSNFSSFVSDPMNPYKNYGVEQLFDFYKTFRPDRKPGTSYEYSNLAVGTLGVILENVFKKSFEQLVVEKICGPLHMNDTRQFIRKTDSLRVAAGYTETGKYNGPWDFSALAAAGSIRSTAADLLRYAKANAGAATGSLRRAIQATHIQTFSDGQNKIGLGWQLTGSDDEPLLFHNGSTGGYRSYIAIDENKKIAVVILSNTNIGVDEAGNELVKWLEKN